MNPKQSLLAISVINNPAPHYTQLCKRKNWERKTTIGKEENLSKMTSVECGSKNKCNTEPINLSYNLKQAMHNVKTGYTRQIKELPNQR